MEIFLNDYKNIKVALIKQEVYNDLYIAKPYDSEFYKKSLKRSGPLGFVEIFNCDFFIVETAEDPECKIWEEKIKAGIGNYRNSIKTQYSNKFDNLTQSECKVKIDQIPYEEYDIIISFDISIPTRIVKTFPKQLWCYYISEPPLSDWKESFSQPLYGYDIFFTQLFSLNKGKEETKSHVIDMPYHAVSSSTYQKLFGFNQIEELEIKNKKPTAILPRYCKQFLSDIQFEKLSEFVEIKITVGTVEAYLRSLFHADYYLRLGNTNKFGNETIEAVASGCLFISSTKGWRNRIFNVKSTTLDSLDIQEQFDALINLIKHHEENPKLKNAAKNNQKVILNRICFSDPMLRLIEKLEEKKIKEYYFI